LWFWCQGQGVLEIMPFSEEDSKHQQTCR
jgi:hypothetical protein